MKNCSFSSHNHFFNKFFFVIWAAFHGLVFIAFLFYLSFNKRINIDSDLFNMLPAQSMGKALSKADTMLSEKTGRNVLILVSHEDFSIAKSTAESVYNSLAASPFFLSITLNTNGQVREELSDFLHKYRWNLFDDETIQSLESKDGQLSFVSNAMENILSPFTMAPLDKIDEDPFLFDEVNFKRYESIFRDSGMKMYPKDGVLASHFEGKWYILLNCVLSNSGAALASSDNGITLIYDVCNPLEKDGVHFVYSGTPFHSHKSSVSASREISIISTLSLIFVLVILFFIFRSIIPIVSSFLSILISISVAFMATQLLIGKIHVLTLVFGTSLIGSCIDYSIHFFMSWRADLDVKDGGEIRNKLIRGLSLSLVSTLLCYTVLLFAPFGLLKQIAVFSIFGLLSSFFTVIGLYSLFPLPDIQKRNISVLNFYKVPSKRVKKILFYSVFSIVAILVLIAVIFFNENILIKNNLTELYKMEGRLKDDTVLSYKVMQYNPSGYFIVSGDSEEDVLEKEEKISKELNCGYISTSRFIPSIEKQRKSKNAVKNLFPYLDEQYAFLGDDETFTASFLSSYEKNIDNFLTLDSELPETVASILSSVYIGEIDNKYYTVVLPSEITDEDEFISIANKYDDVIFVNKVKDISQSIDRLTKLIVIFFCISYFVIMAVLMLFYPFRKVLKILSVPLLVVIVSVSVFAILGMKIGFFSIMGMILVFGLGLDYIIYMVENEKASDYNRKIENFAILVSFLTTAISFGALALSSFVPVHILGLAIFIGLLTAFVCTLF